MLKRAFLSVLAVLPSAAFMPVGASAGDVAPQFCTGRDCLAGQAKPAEPCKGLDCQPPGAGTMQQCGGQDCLPIPEQAAPEPEDKKVQPPKEDGEAAPAPDGGKAAPAPADKAVDPRKP